MTDSSPIALVTGGSRGLGAATALALADAGADVIITYRSSEAQAREVVAAIEARGRRGAALALDASEPAAFGAFADALREQLGGWDHDTFDILVNNAGTALYRPLAEVSEAEIDAVFAVHVKGPLFLTQTLLGLLADGGKIINISSGLTRTSFAGSGGYAAAKAAVETLTRYMALELAPRGITANVVAPGAVPTDFGDGHLRDSKTVQAAVVTNTALARLATPGDIGQAIAGLALASGGWITGQRIEASGGLRL